MPRVRDRLYRFRPAGAPGAAGAAGVPSDHATDMAAELGPLFAQLAATEVACEQITAQAAHDAAKVLDDCRKQANELTRSARAGMDALRADATAQAMQASDAASASALAAAQREAADTLRRAEAHMEHFVELLTESVLRRIEALQLVDDDAAHAR